MRAATYHLHGRPYAALEWGERGGIPTVLLHGYLDHAGAWSRVAPGLSGWIVAIDHRGHGLSPHCGPGESYSFPDYLADLDALLAELGPAKLVGHSMGGTIASMYAGVRPEKVVALVTVDGLGLFDSSTHSAERMTQFLDEMARPPANKVFPSLEAAAARLRHSNPALDEAWATELAGRILRPVVDGFTWTWDARHRIRGPIPYRHDNHAQFLRRIRCPVLAVHPEHSPFAAADVAHLESLVANIRRVTVPGATHMVHLDTPAQLAAAIRPFLDAIDEPPSMG